ncbi:MAG TPA: ABC transporter permease [Candidatus Sulfotelmatobacter sp.]|jgi:putative spermidine/putrescine transport system permease protein|nr:ABC transporter permease [Candidatus Sulfotelmatobacter sp.]
MSNQGGASAPPADMVLSGGHIPLKTKLRRAERMRKITAFGLVAPLLFFVMLTFVIPIAGMLWRSIDDTEFRKIMPQTVAVLADWDGKDLPDEKAFRALAADLAAARDNGTAIAVARRLNYDVNGLRSVVMSAARKADANAENIKDSLIALDPRWGQVETWGAMKRARGPLTSFYILSSLDLSRDATGSIHATNPDHAIYVDVLIRTFRISLTVTLLCLALGFPVAYLMSTQPPKVANILMILVLLPFWTSLLVRTAAWVVLLQNEGIVNNLLIWLGIIEKPLRLIYNSIGVHVAMTHVLLPFMILPLYSTMKAIKPHYMRAAASLGAPPTVAFLRVYLPQCLPGIAAGCLLVFILAIGYYITPALVGGAADQMLSYFIAFFVTDSVNWGMASALGAVLLGTTLALYAVYNRLVGGSGIKMG